MSTCLCFGRTFCRHFFPRACGAHSALCWFRTAKSMVLIRRACNVLQRKQQHRAMKFQSVNGTVNLAGKCQTANNSRVCFTHLPAESERRKTTDSTRVCFLSHLCGPNLPVGVVNLAPPVGVAAKNDSNWSAIQGTSWSASCTWVRLKHGWLR